MKHSRVKIKKLFEGSMRQYFLLSMIFIFHTHIHAMNGPEIAAKKKSAVNKLLTRTRSAELPQIKDTNTGKIFLDLSRLQAGENPNANLPDGRAHPGIKLLERIEASKNSPKGSPKLERKWSELSVKETEDSHDATESLHPRRNTISE